MQQKQMSKTEESLHSAANQIFEKANTKLAELLQVVHDSFLADIKRTIKSNLDEVIRAYRAEENSKVETKVEATPVDQ